MILFYSNSCRHCNVLLETIKKHDTKKTIKLVVIDSIVNKISHKIKAVPALMFIDTKEIIYGKSVFDFLLLPNRGYLFTSNSTREKPENKQNPNSISDENKEIEPISFSLGAISSESFTDITDDDINSLNLNDDKVYKWGLIDENSPSSQQPQQSLTLSSISTKTDNSNSNNNESSSKKNLPSIDELQKQRDLLFK
jgi:hypothetical protein